MADELLVHVEHGGLGLLTVELQSTQGDVNRLPPLAVQQLHQLFLGSFLRLLPYGLLLLFGHVSERLFDRNDVQLPDDQRVSCAEFLPACVVRGLVGQLLPVQLLHLLARHNLLFGRALGLCWGSRQGGHHARRWRQAAHTRRGWDATRRRWNASCTRGWGDASCAWRWRNASCARRRRDASCAWRWWDASCARCWRNTSCTRRGWDAAGAWRWGDAPSGRCCCCCCRVLQLLFEGIDLVVQAPQLGGFPVFVFPCLNLQSAGELLVVHLEEVVAIASLAFFPLELRARPFGEFVQEPVKLLPDDLAVARRGQQQHRVQRVEQEVAAAHLGGLGIHSPHDVVWVGQVELKACRLVAVFSV
mmetsp:Transcript_10415/g.19002  ORF Transcript_10415/g.19002 Transcript_10415/m.19002 type:complete len:360 (+) Transcript_10415:1545-2624(+)